MLKFAMPGAPYLMLAAFVAGGLGAWRIMDWRHDAELARGLKVAIALQDERFRIVTRIETRVQTRIRTIEKRGNDIVREVPVYVTQESDRRYLLPDGFVRVHDAAARNEAPGPAAVTDADPSGIALSASAALIGGSYTEYHACRAQVIEWNAFYGELRKSESARSVR